MKKSDKTAIAIGAGLTALAAAAAGAYMLTGKNAKNRKKLAKWATDMKKDVVKELHQVKKSSKASYAKVIDSVAKNYAGLKNVSAPELAELASELKSNWDVIKSEMDNATKAIKKAIPKDVKTSGIKIAKQVSEASKAISKVAKKAGKSAAKSASQAVNSVKKAAKKATAKK